MARYLRNTESNAITVVQDDDDATWHTLLAQKTTPPNANTSAKPLYEETSEAWVLEHGGASSTAPSAGSGGGIASWAVFTFDDSETQPKPLAQDADVYPLLKTLNSKGSDISLGVDKSSISVAPGLYQVNLSFQIANTPAAGQFESYIDNNTDTTNTLATLGGQWLTAAHAFRGDNTIVVPIVADDVWLLNFEAHIVGGVVLNLLLLTIVKLDDLPA